MFRILFRILFRFPLILIAGALIFPPNSFSQKGIPVQGLSDPVDGVKKNEKERAQEGIQVRDLSDPQQPVIAQARVSSNKTRVADPVILTLTVEGPLGLEVQLPEAILTKESSLFWRVNRLSTRSISDEQKIIYQYEFECSAFTSGDLPLVLAPLKIRRKGGNDTILEFTQALTVNAFVKVSTVSPEALREPTDIERMIPPPNEGPQEGAWVFWWMLLAPPAIGIPLAYWFWKRPVVLPPVEVWDRARVLQNWSRPLSAEQAYSILLRYLQSSAPEKSGSVMTMISQKVDLSEEQKQALLSISQQLETERFDPFPKEFSRAAESLREFFERLPPTQNPSPTEGN
jgi:hypothetical protein